MGNTLDTGANAGVNTGADTVWPTYAELGKARGTNAAAAKRLAMRRRWRRQAGNDGTTGVSVPVSEVRHWKGDAGAHAAVSADASVIKALESAVASLTKRAAAAQNRAERAEIWAEQAEARVNRAEQSLSEERKKRADQAEVASNRLETELDAEKLGRAEAEADAAELREAMQKADHDRTTAVAIADEAVRAAEELRRAEAQRAGQGRWARLRAAWRGE